MKNPSFKSLIPDPKLKNLLFKYEKNAHQAGYDLLSSIDKKNHNKYSNGIYTGIQLATAESITAGLIFSTLVDIPWASYIKYGGVATYDTDAKQTFINVKTTNVFTHNCAKEMAIGVLNNSTASLALAVTGNARPSSHEERIGEVFVGIAGYDAKGNIIYETHAINCCKGLEKMCKTWYNEKTTKGIPYKLSSGLSKLLRYKTVERALKLCTSFVKKYDPKNPKFVIERKLKNTNKKFPKQKYSKKIKLKCKSNCKASLSKKRVKTKVFKI